MSPQPEPCSIPGEDSRSQRNRIIAGINSMGFEYGRLKSNSNQPTEDENLSKLIIHDHNNEH